MGVLDKFINSMKLNDDEEDEDYEDDYLDDDDEAEESQEHVKRPSKVSKTVSLPAEDAEDKPARKNFQSKVTPIHQVQTRRQGTNGMEVCGIKPTSFEDAREVTETLLSNRTVILNLEGLDVDIAQRILDFTSGSCYAISGNLQKISKYVFIITPSSVGVSGDFLDIIGNGGFDTPMQ